ncbi:MAG TPA: hypothetical protein VMF90_18360 [Rhizobiaceae bacterium]|nr:hypothetical protein [Rhizobiaceae bacterium]
MANNAVARETISALRRQIAKIEGRLADEFTAPSLADATVVRRGAAAFREADLFASGAEILDENLGGGLPKAALTEIHAAETRDSGLSAGFVVGLMARLLQAATEQRPLLWIGTAEIFHEAGLPYAKGLAQAFGLKPENLLFAEASKLVDALWIAEEAARLTGLSAVLLELRGNPEKLDLTATRRLHRRAELAGRPVFLVRQSALAEPTAAPVRLVVSPAPAPHRETIAGPVEGTVGNPAFTVSISKSRRALPGQFVLEWNSHDLAFQERKPAHSRRLVSLPRNGADLATALRTVVAFEAVGQAAVGHQSSREQYAEDFGSRRAG